MVATKTTSTVRAVRRTHLIRRVLPRRVILVLLFPAIIATLLALVAAGLTVSSTVRAYVGGESLWSKGQKRAVEHLYRFAITRNDTDYAQYERALSTPLADRRAREELQSPRHNLDTAAAWFVAAQNHPADAKNMARLFFWLHDVPPLSTAIAIWTAGDARIDTLRQAALTLRTVVRAPSVDTAAYHFALTRIARGDAELTRLEDDFSTTFGNGARFMSSAIIIVAVFVGALLAWVGMAVAARLWRQEREAAETERRRDAEFRALRETSNKALEESEAQLRQAQKMEAIGRLAAGIAHDFNSLLTVIGAALDLTLRDTPPDAGVPLELVHNAKKAADRAALLTRQLLAFGRQQIAQRRVLDLPDVVADMRGMLAPLIGEHVHITTTFEPDTPAVFADPGQIGQIVLNLVANARDAMPHGGTISITTRRVARADSGELRSANAIAGETTWAVLEVCDTGEGMDPETKARSFEPFFTTKHDRRGTGLGLSVVYGIVSQNNGQIEVDSVPGAGTTFRIFFPAAGRPRVTGEGHRDGERGATRGHETVLLVEDEESMRSLALHSLSRQGYVVLSAANGVEALHYIDKWQDEPIHLILSDIVMPQMDGIQLARELDKRGIDVPVVFMSGYTNDAGDIADVRDGHAKFLAKPFTIQQLSEIVRQTLDARLEEDYSAARPS